jgi:hypothetical protein
MLDAAPGNLPSECVDYHLAISYFHDINPISSFVAEEKLH